MNYDRYRVSVEKLENGFVVEIPDMVEIAKRQAAEKKKDGKESPCCYYGDLTKKFSCKSVNEVKKIVGDALGQIPGHDYDSAFAEATASKKK